MYGAVFGDIIGSTYELHNVKTTDFELFPSGSQFTDDTVLSVATADKILNEHCACINDKESYAVWYKQYYRRYPHAGYGQLFTSWAKSEDLFVQRSYGNGGAMRVSTIGYAYDSISEIKKQVKYSCYYTHHHYKAIKGAQAIAIAIFLARKECDQDEIRTYIVKNLKYKLKTTLDEIRDNYVFDSRTSYSIPPAIEAFLESNSYEDAIRKAISIGGDSDTIACMAGGIAQAYYKKIPKEIYDQGVSFLDSGLKKVLKEFSERYDITL